MDMTRRTFMIHASAGAGGMLMLPGLAAAAPAASGSGRAVLSESGCSRATGYAETNKIITLDGRTHVCWLDSDADGFRVRIRTLDRTTGEWSAVTTVGEAYDNHGGPALAADSKGYLHIVYYPHHHPFRYRRSVRPNDASEWTDEVQFGTRCTYPTLMVAPDDRLILTCRESNTESKPWVVNRYTKAATEDWSGPTAIMVADESGYSHFQEALAWGPDGKTLHLATRMYGGNPGRAHTVATMKSRDGGETWLTAAGEPIALPATSRTATAIADESDGQKHGYRGGSIAVNADGEALILYSDASAEAQNAWLIKIEADGRMLRQSLLPYARILWENAVLGMPGGVNIDEKGRVHVVLTAAHTAGKIGWGRPENEIMGLTAAAFGEPFTPTVLSETDPETPHWLPNIERATGHNVVPPNPGVIYTAGGPGGKNTELVSNRVIWVN